MKCPQCGAHGPFTVYLKVTAKLEGNGGMWRPYSFLIDGVEHADPSFSDHTLVDTVGNETVLCDTCTGEFYSLEGMK